MSLQSRLRAFGGRWSTSGDRAWVVPFGALVVLLFFGEMAVAPGRSLFAVYSEAELGRPPYFTSALLSTQVFFGAIAAFVGGVLADALGQKRVLIIGATGLPLVGLVFLVGSPWALVALWVYIGLTFGLYTIGRQSYMMAVVPASSLGIATALVFTGNTLGSALGNSLAAPLVDSYGFRYLGIAIMMVAGVVFFGGLLAMPDLRSTGKAIRSRQSFGGYGGVLKRPGVRYIGLIRFLPTAYWGTATLLMPLLIYRASGTASAAAYYGTASLLFASACQLMAGRICDRYGRRRLVTFLCAGIAVISLATAAFTHNLPGLYVCGILGAGIAWSLSTTIPHMVNDVAPRLEHGRALGFMHIAWSAGNLIGTQVGGWLVDTNSSLPFIIMGLVNLITVAGALALGPRLDRPGGCELEPETEQG